MNSQQSNIITMGVVAIGFNAYGATIGATSKNEGIGLPVLGGFIVIAILLALAEPMPVLAEAFAGAYMATSVLVNGNQLITAINKMSGGTTDTSAAGGGGHVSEKQ